MNLQSRSEKEINQWHKDFEQTRQHWQEWLTRNFDNFQSTKDAWNAFTAQQQNRIAVPRIKTLH